MKSAKDMRSVLEEIKMLAIPTLSVTPPTLPPAPETSWMPKLRELVGFSEIHLPNMLSAAVARMDDSSAAEFKKEIKKLAGTDGALQKIIETLRKADRMMKDADPTIEGAQLRQLLFQVELP